MKSSIYPCLWFDGKAKEAAELYCQVFGNSRITSDTPLVVKFEIEGKEMMGLNGGPMFQINPSISLFVHCATVEELDQKWAQLSEGGKVMMPVDKYPWNERYGWVADRFGVSWQLMLSPSTPASDKIIPSFLFTGAQYGRGEEAMKTYTGIFPDAKIDTASLYGPNEPQPEGKLKYGHFTLRGEGFVSMDGFGNHAFGFNEGFSLVVECDTQDEIDGYWNKLTADGGQESQCGWLKDKFGVSWQIVPKVLEQLMSDPERRKRVMDALMKMKKLDMAALENA